jgi:hypothetical protein
VDGSARQLLRKLCLGVNQFNGSTQFNYAAKHNPQVFFTDSNGGDDPTPANPLSHNYAPLQQLFVDLANNSVADYNWITPNQFNDMHSTLQAGFLGLTGDAANIRQGDNFLSIVVPEIMASAPIWIAARSSSGGTSPKRIRRMPTRTTSITPLARS